MLMKNKTLKPLSLALMLALVPLSVSTAHASDKNHDDGKIYPSVPVHFIGDSYQGGIVFYVDADGQHGLIAAKADQGTSGIQWYNGTVRVTGTAGDGLGAGSMNTAIIVATQIRDNQSGNFAAKVAADYSVQEDGVTPCTVAQGLSHPPVTETCYGDWYLPSKVELNLLYTQKAVVGGFAQDWYYSSTEFAIGGAWGQYFGHGTQDDGTQDYFYKGATNRVRAVRSF